MFQFVSLGFWDLGLSVICQCFLFVNGLLHLVGQGVFFLVKLTLPTLLFMSSSAYKNSSSLFLRDETPQDWSLRRLVLCLKRSTSCLLLARCCKDQPRPEPLPPQASKEKIKKKKLVSSSSVIKYDMITQIYQSFIMFP